MVLGFDKMTGIVSDSSANTDPANLEDAILPAALSSRCGRRAACTSAAPPEHLAKIAAKNWHNGGLNPMAQRQPDKPVPIEKVPVRAWWRGR